MESKQHLSFMDNFFALNYGISFDNKHLPESCISLYLSPHPAHSSANGKITADTHFVVSPLFPSVLLWFSQIFPDTMQMRFCGAQVRNQQPFPSKSGIQNSTPGPFPPESGVFDSGTIPVGIRSRKFDSGPIPIGNRGRKFDSGPIPVGIRGRKFIPVGIQGNMSRILP